MLLVGDDPRAQRAVIPAVGHAADALELGIRSMSSLVSAAGRVRRTRRTLRPEDWEREVVRLRYAAWDSAPGPARAQALRDYGATVADARLAVGARSPSDARARVEAVLRLEQRLLSGKRLTAGERAIAQRAVARSLADVSGHAIR